MPDHKKPSGLQDVVIGESEICYIDGRRGQLVYRGYDIDDLAEHSTFEEVAYLLWHGKLPTKPQLESLQQQLGEAAVLPAEVIGVLRGLPKDSNVMRVLEVGTATLGILNPQGEDTSPAANGTKAVRLMAQMALLTTTWHRLRQGLELLPYDPRQSLASNFLTMLQGVPPDSYAAHTLDVALILHADHELNASTFAARVTAGTMSDMHSAVVSAIGALKGPLHGGANEQVMAMLEQIGTPDKVDAYMKELLDKKQKVMGFGHRVYRAKDPRATILEKMSEELGRRAGDTKWYEMSHLVEQQFQPVVAAKGVYPNVDFYSASAYHVLGLPKSLFTPVFACSRVVGWTAHIMEQHANNRIIRPTSDYVGPEGLKWVPFEQR